MFPDDTTSKIASDQLCKSVAVGKPLHNLKFDVEERVYIDESEQVRH